MEQDKPQPVDYFAQVKAHNSIDYMLRNTQQHHVQLSAMADLKANILIGGSSLIFTVSLSQIHHQDLRWGLVVLCLFTLGSAFTAILAVMPHGHRKQPLLPGNPDFNPLFFGHFAILSREEYSEEMGRMMQDDKKIYEAIVRDTYQLGYVLYHKKYYFLYIGYRLFLTGMCLATLMLLVQIFIGL